MTEQRKITDLIRDAWSRLRPPRAEQSQHDPEQSLAEVIQQERLSALGQMAGGVTHHLSNTLSPVLAYSELLLDGPGPATENREMLAAIRDAAQDATAIIARLQQFARPPNGCVAKETFELATLVTQVAEWTRTEWQDQGRAGGQAIDILVDVQEPSCVRGQEEEVREVLNNVISNAAEAMPSGGRIVLRVRREQRFGVVDVSDTGSGMSPDTQRRCFEPFYTTKGPGRMGLGLSVCHGILRRHDGLIEIDTSQAQGTTVRISLPLG